MGERLLTIAEDVLDAWRSERAVFRRAELDGAQLSVRRGPGNGPLRVSLIGSAHVGRQRRHHAGRRAAARLRAVVRSLRARA